jgi:hypothetical protein
MHAGSDGEGFAGGDPFLPGDEAQGLSKIQQAFARPAKSLFFCDGRFLARFPFLPIGSVETFADAHREQWNHDAWN